MESAPTIKQKRQYKNRERIRGFFVIKMLLTFRRDDSISSRNIISLAIWSAYQLSLQYSL